MKKLVFSRKLWVKIMKEHGRSDKYIKSHRWTHAIDGKPVDGTGSFRGRDIYFVGQYLVDPDWCCMKEVD